MLPREAYDLLDVIAGTEAPDYRTIYGGQKVNDLSWHPGIAVPIERGPNAGRTSSAAGRYQFLESTWNDQARKLNLEDFSPSSQDAAAWNLANEEFSRRTGGDLLTALQERGGPDRQILGALRNQWTSLPGGIEENARYRNGQGVQVADSGQSQSDAGPSYLQPIQGKERDKLLGRLGGQTGAAPAPEPEAEPSQRPSLAPIQGEERDRLLSRLQPKQEPQPQAAPQEQALPETKPPGMADVAWENIKKAYGATSDMLTHQGKVIGNAIGQGVMAPIGLLSEAERQMRDVSYPPGTFKEGSPLNWMMGSSGLPSLKATLDAGTPWPNTKEENIGDQILGFTAPMAVLGGLGKAPALYDELATTLPPALRAGEALVRSVAREVPLSAATGAAAKGMNQVIDPKENPILGTAAELVAAGAVPVGQALATGGGRIANALTPKKVLERQGEGEVAAMQFALGIDEGTIRYLPKGVTPDHLAEALRLTQKSTVQNAADMTTPQLMTTRKFRDTLSQVSGQTVQPGDLNPFLKRAAMFTENPLTNQAKELVDQKLTDQARAVTDRALAGTSVGADVDRLSAAPQRLHRRVYTAGQLEMAKVSDDLDQTIQRSLGDTKIPDNQVADTVRRTLQASDDMIEAEASRRYGVVRETHGQPIVHPIENIASYRRANIGFNDRGERKFYEYPESALSQTTQAVLKQIDGIGASPLKNPFNEVSGNRPFLMQEQLPEVYGMYKEEAENLYKQINSALRSDLPDLDVRVLNQMKSALMRDREQLVPEAKAFMGEEAFGKYQQDFTDAVSYWKQMKQLQGEKTIQAIQNKQTGGQWDLNATQVQRNLLSSGDSVRAYQELAKAGGVDPSPALRESIASKVDDFIVSDPTKGVSFNSKSFDTWYRKNQDMIGALPDDVKASIDAVRVSKESFDLQKTIRDAPKLKALLGSDPAETSSHKIVNEMLTKGQKGLNRGDFNKLQEATGIERKRLSTNLGDAIMYQLQTDEASHNPLTVRQRLDALTNNYPFLKAIYEDRPDVAEGIRGLQDLYKANANLARIKMGGVVGSNTANKALETAFASKKFENTALGEVAIRLGFVIGGGIGNPLMMAGSGVKGGTLRLLDVASKSLAQVYLDPRAMAAALESPNMQKAVADRAVSIAEQFMDTSKRVATGEAVNALRDGRFVQEEKQP
jgi:muramidase (phage lysozyme)